MSNRLRASLSKRGRVLRPRSSSRPPAAPDAQFEEDVRESGETESVSSAPPPVIEVAAPPPEPVRAEAPAPMIAAPEPPPPPPPPVVETPPPVVAAAPPVVEPLHSAAPPVTQAVVAPVAAPVQGGGKKKKKKKHHSDRPSAQPAQSAQLEAPKPAQVAQAEAKPAEAPSNGAPVAAKVAPVAAKELSSSSAKHPKPSFVTASGKPVDEEVDLSISHKFFVDGDSMPPPPVHEEHEHLLHEEKLPPPTKEALAHRARLKRIVGGVVIAAGVFALIGVGKALFTSKSADAMPTNTALESKLPEPKKAETAAPKETAAAISEKATDKKDDAKPADTAAPSATASADAAKPDDAKPEDKKDDAKKDDEKKDDASAKSPKEIKDLKTKAAMLANGGDMTKAIDAAKDAISADPTDAMSYMYLYSDYTNIGKMKDANEALNDCVRNATSADKWQCSQWGGHK